MQLNLIVAYAQNRVIGRDNTLPWKLPSDLAHFKRTTLGHPVIMGRKTWESLGRPLPGRRNIVLTRDPDYRADGADVVTSIEAALAEPQTWVIGGSEIYHLALPAATRCEVTEVEIDLRLEDDDALAPVLDESWVGTSGDWHDSTSGLRYRFHNFLRP